MCVYFCPIFRSQRVNHKDQGDGAESTEDTSSPRASSPSARSKSPESEPVSPSTSPLETSTSPPHRETSPIDRSITPKRRAASPVQSQQSPEGRPESPKERPVSPLTDELSQEIDNVEQNTETKRSAMYDEVEESLAAFDAIADDIGKDVAEREEQQEITEVIFYANTFGDGVAIKLYRACQLHHCRHCRYCCQVLPSLGSCIK